MEALSALSLASNIVQFLEFGLRVLSKGNQIYRSVDGALEENLDLEIVTSDLLVIQTKLKCTLLSLDHVQLAPDDVKAFNTMSESCGGLAKKLLERLNMVKAQGRFRRWKSLRQALKVVWSKTDIESMTNTLQSFRSQMQIHLLISLKNKVDVEALERSRSANQFDETASRILQALKNNADVFDSALIHQTATLNMRLEETGLLLQQSGHEIRTSTQAVGQKTENLYDNHSYLFECAVSGIIASLSFPGMDDLFERVVDAHANTYSWIFEPKSIANQRWDSFSSWLEQENGDPIYWITGKAASGKSTLMRYIFENQGKLRKSLDAWRQGRPLMTPKFYFWSTGTAVQKSQNGLFRSLLHQVFQQDRSLVEEILPDLVRSTLSLPRRQLSKLELRGTWRSWSLNELKQTFCNLIKRNKIRICYFFLIDGLDEYDGDYLELSMFLKTVSTCSNVKLCLSSRPLLAFEHHFGDFPKLRLQDLTVGDISRFVRDTLEEHPRFYAFVQEEPQKSSNLIGEIVQTSCGVFLWVSLVVKSLSEGLTNHDSLSDLQKRLRELPPELEGLYKTMLNSISPPFYLEQASRLLQLVYQSPSPLSAAELSFADDDDQDLAIKAEIGSVTTLDLIRRSEAMIPKLKSRCAGLLEVQVLGLRFQRPVDFSCSYVQYLHLTVKEYLEKPHVWANLLALTRASGFNANVSLLRSKLIMLKSANTPISKWYVKSIIPLALLAEDSTGRAQTALLEELDTTVSQIAFARSDSSGGHWLSHLLHKGLSCDRCPDSILTFAVRSGLTLFVKDCLQRSRELQKSHETRSLLDYATWYYAWDRDSPAVKPSMVAMLFDEGFRPNDESCGSTPWRALLNFLVENKRWTLPIDWVDVCKLFVLSGADLKTGCEVQGRWKSVWEVLESAFQHLPGHSLAELKRMVTDRSGARYSGPSQSNNKHRRYRHRNRNSGQGLLPTHHPNAQRGGNHPQDLYTEDHWIADDRFRAPRYPRNRAGRHEPQNAERSSQYRHHAHSPRHDSSRRSFVQHTEASVPSMPSQSRRWRPY